MEQVAVEYLDQMQGPELSINQALMDYRVSAFPALLKLYAYSEEDNRLTMVVKLFSSAGIGYQGFEMDQKHSPRPQRDKPDGGLCSD